MIKLVIPATLVAALFTTSAFAADVPMPECVDNPACQQGSGCSTSGAPAGAAGAGVVLLAGALALAARRRRR